MRYSMYAMNLAAVTALFGCQSIQTSNEPKQPVERATQQWITAFNNCDESAAAALYSKQPVLWGTVTPTLITSSEGVRQYFERVCSSNPKPKVELQEQRAREFGDTAVNTVVV